MTTFTVWRFDDAEGADRAYAALRGAAADGLVHVVDHAVVSWPGSAAEPSTSHGHEDAWRATGWGALWGALVGGLFFVPVLGAAAGAAAGAVSKAQDAVGIGADEIARIREQVVPGTSALFVVTDGADTDRLAERFHGVHAKLVETNLTEAERSRLRESFGG